MKKEETANKIVELLREYHANPKRYNDDSNELVQLALFLYRARVDDELMHPVGV